MRELTHAKVFLVFQLDASKMCWVKSRNHIRECIDNKDW